MEDHISTSTLTYILETTKSYDNNGVFTSGKERFPLGAEIAWNILCVFGVIINSFHLTVICTQPQLKKALYFNFKLFLVMMGGLDLVQSTLRVVFSNEYFQQILAEYHKVCVATAVINNIKYWIDITLIFLLCIDIAICFKLRERYHANWYVKAFRYFVVAICVVSTVSWIIGGIYYPNFIETDYTSLCKANGMFSTPISSFQVVTMTAAFLIALVTYITLWCVAHRRIIRSEISEQMKTILKVTRVLGPLIAWKVFIGIPITVAYFLDAGGLLPMSLVIALKIALALRSCAIPIIYGLTNECYRKTVKQELTSCCVKRVDSCNPSSAVSHSGGLRTENGISERRSTNTVYTIREGTSVSRL